MNIFVLDWDAEICASYHCDKHICKMIIETAQILSSVHWMNNQEAPYKLTHKNHPCCVWARDSLSNYRWLTQLGIELCKEYTNRYKRIHQVQSAIEWLMGNEPQIIDIGFTSPPQAMPEQYKGDDAVEAYRRYYLGEKIRFARWKHSEIPLWFMEGQNNER